MGVPALIGNWAGIVGWQKVELLRVAMGADDARISERDGVDKRRPKARTESLGKFDMAIARRFMRCTFKQILGVVSSRHFYSTCC